MISFKAESPADEWTHFPSQPLEYSVLSHRADLEDEISGSKWTLLFFRQSLEEEEREE